MAASEQLSQDSDSSNAGEAKGSEPLADPLGTPARDQLIQIDQISTGYPQLPVPDLSVPPSTARSRRLSTGHTIGDRVGSILGDDGRTYQAYMPEEYQLPNDGDEQERLDIQHTIYLGMLDGRLHAAPVHAPRHVLDIGTGTGIWAFHFARRNPTSFVIGTDLSSIQPIPRVPNVQFWVENSETQEWVFPCMFDFIHLRAMGPCFNDSIAVIQKCYRNMNSNAWIELQDGSWEWQSSDGTLRGTALERWYQSIIIGAARLGRDMIKAKFYKEYLSTAGFVDIAEQVLPILMGNQPRTENQRKMGLLTAQALHFAVESYRNFVLAAGLSPMETEDLLRAAQRDLQNEDIHFHVNTYFVYGRKP